MQRLLKEGEIVLIFTCEYNPMNPCPFNDGEGGCTAEDVELTSAPYGKLRCDTRMWYEREHSTAPYLSKEGSK